MPAAVDPIPRTRPWHRLDDGRVQCDICPRACRLREGQRGMCFVRMCQGGEVVLTTYGRSSGFCVGPREKKPLNPFLAQDPRQKARRLARALVSDMIVYQPDKRQKALKEGNLKEAFEEEIKKSWEEYVAQVGDDLANSTTFFTEALNEILAGGQKVF